MLTLGQSPCITYLSSWVWMDKLSQLHSCPKKAKFYCQTKRNGEEGQLVCLIFHQHTRTLWTIDCVLLPMELLKLAYRKWHCWPHDKMVMLDFTKSHCDFKGTQTFGLKQSKLSLNIVELIIYKVVKCLHWLKSFSSLVFL